MPRPFRIVLILCTLAFASTCRLEEASARRLFVSNVAGDDSANGQYPESSDIGGPVRSISRALALASAGDHIVIANTGAPYRESLSLSSGNQSGFVALPFIIEGNGAVLDGSALVPADAWEAVRGDLYRFRPAGGGNLRLFDRQGKPAPEKPVDRVNHRLPQLAAGEWCAHAGYAYFQCAAGKLPREHGMSYAALPVGITLYHVHDVRIVDLTIQGFQRDGVNVHDGTLDISLAGLTLRGNGRCGLAVGGSSQVIVEGCLIGDNGQAQTIVDGPATLGLQNCNILENPAPALVRPRRGERVYIDGALKE